MRNNKKTVAEICLYGTMGAAGWIASYRGTSRGDGEPKQGVCYTEAIWAAMDALRQAGAVKGLCRIYEPTGRFMATVKLNSIPRFGDLKWEPAPVYTIELGN